MFRFLRPSLDPFERFHSKVLMVKMSGVCGGEHGLSISSGRLLDTIDKVYRRVGCLIDDQVLSINNIILMDKLLIWSFGYHQQHLLTQPPHESIINKRVGYQ
jgi:hypothetical protein